MNRRRFLATLIAAPVAASAALRAPVIIPARTMFASVHFTPEQLAFMAGGPRVLFQGGRSSGRQFWLNEQYRRGIQWERVHMPTVKGDWR